MDNLEIKYLPVDLLKMYGKNPRKNDEAVKYVRNSIESFGWRVPVIVDRNMVVIAGHTRIKAAKLLGIKEIPCVVADDLTDEQATAFRLIDNKTQELSSWDFSKLIKELDETIFNMSDFGFDPIDDDDDDSASGGSSRKATQDLDSGEELNIDDFSDEQFTCQCPSCGFRFND